VIRAASAERAVATIHLLTFGLFAETLGKLSQLHEDAETFGAVAKLH